MMVVAYDCEYRFVLSSTAYWYDTLATASLLRITISNSVSATPYQVVVLIATVITPTPG